MTDFAVTGKKRSGKGLFCAGVIRDAVRAGKRVATNMDINLDVLVGPLSKVTIIRLPDSPTVDDMEAIGIGYDGDTIDEEKNGVIVLDECSKFFNSRSWGDKSRQPLLDWLIHSGKLRWDIYYQMQGLDQVDKQLRTTQIEYHIPVKRLDRWPIPFVTFAFGLIGMDVRFPKIHLGIIKQGCDLNALKVGRKWYKAKELYGAYDTEQKFLDRDHPAACGLHTVISPWHYKGRYLGKAPSKIMQFLYNLRGIDWTKLQQPKTPVVRAKLPLVQLLMQLPEEQRLHHWHRLESVGAFSGWGGEAA